ncbi:hypothetical protein JOL62DRAFT_208508 [Phyllosticta paracitricarpa]|uniref:Secreted protein n=1 Tax=Phyllosticta paracitricarpa TaxID=2016321 RepID=A0ABR1N0Q4_9PEZI
MLLLLLLLLLPPRAALPSSSDPWLSASLRAFVRGLCRAPMSVGRRIATASISIFSNHQHTLFYGFACLPFPPDSGIADLAMAPGFTWQRRLPVQATRDILAGKSLTPSRRANPHGAVRLGLAVSSLAGLAVLSLGRDAPRRCFVNNYHSNPLIFSESLLFAFPVSQRTRFNESSADRLDGLKASTQPLLAAESPSSHPRLGNDCRSRSKPIIGNGRTGSIHVTIRT